MRGGPKILDPLLYPGFCSARQKRLQHRAAVLTGKDEMHAGKTARATPCPKLAAQRNNPPQRYTGLTPWNPKDLTRKRIPANRNAFKSYSSHSSYSSFKRFSGFRF